MSTTTQPKPSVEENNGIAKEVQEEPTQSTQQPSQQSDKKTDKKKRHQRKPVDMDAIPKDKKQLQKYIVSLEKKFGGKNAPDAKKKEKKVTKIENQIMRLQEKIAKIKDKMDKQKEQWPEQAKKIQLQKEIDQLSKQIKPMDAEFKNKKKMVDSKIQGFQAAVQDKREFVDKCFVRGVFNAEDIEKKLKEYSHELTTSVASKQDEKRLVRLINKLEVSKNQLPKLDSHNKKIDQLKAQINDAKKERTEFKGRLDELYKKRSELIKERDANSKELHKKFGSKKTDYHSMKDARAQISKLYKEKSAVFQAFHEEGDAYYGMQRQLRAAKSKLKDIEYHERKAEREAERERKRQDNLKKAKLFEELRLKEEAEQAAKEKEEALRQAEEEKEEKLFALRNPFYAQLSTAKPLLSYVANLSKGKKRRRGRGGFKHDFGKLSAFQELGIPIPMNPHGVSAATKLLKERIAFWEEETKKCADKELPKEEEKEEVETEGETQEETQEETQDETVETPAETTEEQ